MDTHDLQVFVNLTNTLHFGRAGDLSHLSRSAMTRTIQRLESEVGAALFRRDNRRVSLTPAGQTLRRYATDILLRWREGMDHARQENEHLQGELRLYASVTACYTILPEILSRFRAGYPMVNIALRTGDAASALRRVRTEDIDVSVAALPDELPAEIHAIVVADTPLVFVGPNIDCEVKRLVDEGIHRWDTVPLIVAEKGLARERLDSWYRDHGIRPRIYAQVSGNEAILAMVSLGFGLGVVPRLVLSQSPVRAEITEIPDSPDLSPYEVAVVTQSARADSPIIRAFLSQVTPLETSAQATT